MGNSVPGPGDVDAVKDMVAAGASILEIIDHVRSSATFTLTPITFLAIFKEALDISFAETRSCTLTSIPTFARCPMRPPWRSATWATGYFERIEPPAIEPPAGALEMTDE